MDMADEASGQVIADSSVPAPTTWDDAGADIDVAENTEP